MKNTARKEWGPPSPFRDMRGGEDTPARSELILAYVTVLTVGQERRLHLSSLQKTC